MQQRSTRYTRWLAPVALSGALLVSSLACSDDDTTTLILVAATITVSSGNGQAGVFGQPLAQPIVVHVADRNGASIAGVLVNWTVLAGVGSVSASTSQTDANGNASITWTMGPSAFVDTLQATIANGASVIITA